jgi:hypothetical protein
VRLRAFLNQVELGMQGPVDVVLLWIMIYAASVVTGVECCVGSRVAMCVGGLQGLEDGAKGGTSGNEVGLTVTQGGCY